MPCVQGHRVTDNIIKKKHFIWLIKSQTRCILLTQDHISHRVTLLDQGLTTIDNIAKEHILIKPQDHIM